MLRQVTEKICHVYNSFYQVGFPDTTLLEEYLCYTDDEEHNVMVSRFLSVVRPEQRDRLEWLRVWGDECARIAPKELEENTDKLYLNVKKMMVYMLDATREMCEKIDHLPELEDWIFEEDILPGYVSEDERRRQEKQRRRENRKSRLQIFKKR